MHGGKRTGTLLFLVVHEWCNWFQKRCLPFVQLLIAISEEEKKCIVRVLCMELTLINMLIYIYQMSSVPVSQLWFHTYIRILDHGPCLQGSEGDNYTHIIWRSALVPMFPIFLRTYVPRSLEPWLWGATILASSLDMPESPLDMKFLSNCIGCWSMQTSSVPHLEYEKI